MSWSPEVHAAMLLITVALAAWAGIVARGRHSMPGSAAFSWAMFAIAWWALTGAMHAVVENTATRVTISRFQYVGIVSVAPLWLLFASQYARARWLRDGPMVWLLWAVPAISVVLAFTNEWHHLLWASIELVSAGGADRLVYFHGAWFWCLVVFTYGCLAGSTLLLFRTLRRFPLPHRRQRVLFVLGALLPWSGNVLYVTGQLPPGMDLTPVAFAASGALVLWGFYRHRLLGLVPIARDLVIDSMDDAVIVLDQQRNLVDFNPAAERLAGCSAEGVGQPIDQVVPWWTRASADGVGPPLPAVIAFDRRHLEVQVKAVRDGHELFAGWLILARDVSARRRADAQRRDFERRIQEQQKLESLSVLAGGVAHDFNNLLTGILGNADLVAMKAVGDPALRKSADAIVIGAQRAADLVAKMLAYAGEGRVIAEQIDLDALVREMRDLLEAAVARHCTLEYRRTGALPPVTVDPTQIRQVVLNLVINATEAVDDGGNVLIVTGTETLDAAVLESLTFSADARPGTFTSIQVSDNGPGMDRATMARIFDPFFSTKQTGRGLGLAAVQGIVRSHRGALNVSSVPGKGTTFKVWIPTAPVSPTAVPPAAQDPQPIPQSS